MVDSTTTDGEMNNSDMIDLTGKITVVAVLLVFIIVVFVFLLHIYAKWYWSRRREELINSNEAATHRRFVDDLNFIASRRQGLDSSVLKTIPVVVFSATEFKEGLECAVCLCEVSEGEKARLLPNCNHGFHVNCIDMWFKSHSSCPICRNFVTNQPNSIHESIIESPRSQNSENHTSESPRNFPTNVLFWGNDVEVRTLGNYTEETQQPVFGPSSSTIPSPSSRSRTTTSNRLDGVLVIDIPQQINDDEELKSPLPTRLGSLKRLLSRDNRRVGPCCSPRDCDIEQATTTRS